MDKYAKWQKWFALVIFINYNLNKIFFSFLFLLIRNQNKSAQKNALLFFASYNKYLKFHNWDIYMDRSDEICCVLKEISRHVYLRLKKKKISAKLRKISVTSLKILLSNMIWILTSIFQHSNMLPLEFYSF